MRLVTKPAIELLRCVVVVVLIFSIDASAREFRLGLQPPQSHVWSQAAISFAAALKDASGGRHSVTIYPAQQLGNESQMLQQLQAGVIDMAFLTAAEISNRVPDFGALYAPYLVDDISGAAEVLRSNEAAALLEQLPRKVGVMGVGFGMGGLRQILMRERTVTAGDLRGKKLRITPLAPVRDFYRLVGAAPTPMPLSSVYDALSNGQVDGIDMDLEMTLKLSFHEQADTLLLSNHMMFPMVGLVSARVWVQLDETDQRLIRDLMRAELEWILDLYVVEEARFEQLLRNSDVHFLDVGPEFFGAAIEEWDEKWREQAPSLRALRQIGDATRQIEPGPGPSN